MRTLESARLLIREIDQESLAALLPVYTSNPEALQHNEGSEGEPGRYDLDRWQRDWHIAQLMGRVTLGCYLKESDTPVGYIDLMVEKEDEVPWLGYLLIHRDYQRQGLGTEALRELARYLTQELGYTLIRASVSESNTPAMSFVRKLGFQPYAQVTHDLASGPQLINRLELNLADPASE